MQVYPTPIASFTVADTCLKENTQFTNTTTISSPDFYLWNFGDGVQVSTSGDASHTYSSIGSYHVSLIAVTTNGCRDTSSTTTFKINPLPVVTITTRPQGDTIFFNGGSVTLIANGAASYLWNTSASTDSIAVAQSGSYSVMGTDARGCSAMANINVINKAIPDTVAVSSNILTPNGDGINDYLIIQNKEAYTSCTLNVYNIWNVLVYSKDGYNNDWGGTYNGKQLPDGAYYYIITCDDKPVLNGNINILLK